ncbi:MAG: aminoacyltransferase [Erysipelotrichaceae bacterium]|nr:aminoacyltransferase [Erysipelotrichaceae bacterium]
MKLHEIDAKTFNELSFAEPDTCIFQTSFYADYMVGKGYQASFLEYIDDAGICQGLCLLLKKKESFLSRKYSAYVPYGFLINYYDVDILRGFHELLIGYLRKENIAKLIIEPPLKEKENTVLSLLQDLGYQKTEDLCRYEEPVASHVEGLHDTNIVLKIERIEDASAFAVLSSGKKEEADKLRLFDCLQDHGICYAAKLDLEKSRRAIKESIEELEKFINANKDDYKFLAQIKEKENEIDRLKGLGTAMRRFDEDPYVYALCLSRFSDICTILFKISGQQGDIFDAERQIIDQICADCKNRGIISIGSSMEFPYAKKVPYLGRFILKI